MAENRPVRADTADSLEVSKAEVYAAAWDEMQCHKPGGISFGIVATTIAVILTGATAGFSLMAILAGIAIGLVSVLIAGFAWFQWEKVKAPRRILEAKLRASDSQLAESRALASASMARLSKRDAIALLLERGNDLEAWIKTGIPVSIVSAYDADSVLGYLRIIWDLPRHEFQDLGYRDPADLEKLNGRERLFLIEEGVFEDPKARVDEWKREVYAFGERELDAAQRALLHDRLAVPFVDDPSLPLPLNELCREVQTGRYRLAQFLPQ